MILMITMVFFVFLPQSCIKQSVAHASFRVLRPSLAPMPAIMRSRLCGCLREAYIFVFLYFCILACVVVSGRLGSEPSVVASILQANGARLSHGKSFQNPFAISSPQFSDTPPFGSFSAHLVAGYNIIG